VKHPENGAKDPIHGEPACRQHGHLALSAISENTIYITGEDGQLLPCPADAKR
jgi:hypothetical protein